MSDKEKKTKTTEIPKLSGDAKKIMDMVEKMTVLELSDLVKALEDKFGVTAAAPVAVAGTAGGNGGQEEDTPTEKAAYDVVLKSAGDQKIAVIKAVRELNKDLTLQDANALVTKGEAKILESTKKEDAETAKKQLEEAGATVELV